MRTQCFFCCLPLPLGLIIVAAAIVGYVILRRRWPRPDDYRPRAR